MDRIALVLGAGVKKYSGSIAVDSNPVTNPEMSLGSLVELVVSNIGEEAQKHLLRGSRPRRHAEGGRYIAINKQARELLGWEPLGVLKTG